MIDEKKIEEAAINASIEDTDKGRVREDYVIGAMADHELGFQDGFKAGINWFKDNLWHDAKEEPKLVKKEGVALLLEHECNGIKTHQVFFYEGDDFFRNYLKKQVIRWLYIEDLMKGGK